MLNKVTLIGNLGSDPDVRYTQSNAAIANTSIATTRKWKDKQTNEKKEATEWHRVVFFNRLGEIAGEYLKKGSKVYVEGRLQTRKWEKDGQEHYTTEIIAEVLHMLGGKADNAGEQSAYRAPPTQASSPPPLDDFDDDIPF